MTRPDLVIFDCDGVLVDSEPASNEVIVANLARHGLSLNLAEAMKLFVGGTIAGVGDKARTMGADLPDDWITEIYAEIYARLRAGIAPIPGITVVLDQLDAAGVPYCVGSNGSEEKMQITLGGTGLLPRFEGRLFSAHTHGTAKPEPELFLIAARHMGVTPTQAVVIEDSTSGATAAHRARMRCYGYAPEGGEALAAVGAQVFRDMAELPGLLRIV